MKTTVTISVEKVEKGYMVKINHGGDQLEPRGISEVDAGLREYWRAIEMQSNAVESLRIMKTKRKDMKKFINDSIDWLDQCQGEGMLRESDEDRIPF